MGTYQSQGQMDCGWSHDVLLGRLPAVDHGGDVLGGGDSLLRGRARRLVRPGIGHVPDGKQVRVRGVSELHRRLHADEAVLGVDQGLGRGRRQGREELCVGRLAGGLNHEVDRERPAILEGDLDRLAVATGGISPWGYLDTRAANESVGQSATRR